MASKSGRYVRDKLGRFANTNSVGGTSKSDWNSSSALASGAKTNDAAVQKLRQKRDALKSAGAPKQQIERIQLKINAQRFQAADRRERMRILKAESKGVTVRKSANAAKAQMRASKPRFSEQAIAKRFARAKLATLRARKTAAKMGKLDAAGKLK